jgi:hypothetical protein
MRPVCCLLPIDSFALDAALAEASAEQKTAPQHKLVLHSRISFRTDVEPGIPSEHAVLVMAVSSLHVGQTSRTDQKGRGLWNEMRWHEEVMSDESGAPSSDCAF